VHLSVVLVHWGRNYRPLTHRQRHLARALTEAGAGLVVGHHPHIPQPVAWAPTPVLYSLGNAALGTPGRFHSGRPPYGLVATFDITTTGIEACTLRLIHVDNSAIRFRPEPARDSTAVAFLQSLLGSPGTAADSADGSITIHR
ncbi:MAG TPA: CapA family protein, partial [Rugosimonospora sp.]|nr:CapA family protein [Rugosimonospora sp.]